MSFRILAALLVLALAGCGPRTHPDVLPAQQVRLGAATDYGPGIVGVTSSDVDLKLDAPAYVIALRVTQGLGVQLVAPLSGSPESKTGTNYFRASAASEVSRSAQLPASVSSRPCTRHEDSRESCVGLTAPRYQVSKLMAGAPPEAAGYWLLIVSDAPAPPRDIMRRLEGMNLPDTSLVDLVRRIPAPLMAARTSRWAAYYAPFGNPIDQ